jgi:hypothetical protein
MNLEGLIAKQKRTKMKSHIQDDTDTRILQKAKVIEAESKMVVPEAGSRDFGW